MGIGNKSSKSNTNIKKTTEYLKAPTRYIVQEMLNDYTMQGKSFWNLNDRIDLEIKENAKGERELFIIMKEGNLSVLELQDAVHPFFEGRYMNALHNNHDGSFKVSLEDYDTEVDKKRKEVLDSIGYRLSDTVDFYTGNDEEILSGKIESVDSNGNINIYVDFKDEVFNVSSEDILKEQEPEKLPSLNSYMVQEMINDASVGYGTTEWDSKEGFILKLDAKDEKYMLEVKSTEKPLTEALLNHISKSFGKYEISEWNEKNAKISITEIEE